MERCQAHLHASWTPPGSSQKQHHKKQILFNRNVLDNFWTMEKETVFYEQLRNRKVAEDYFGDHGKGRRERNHG